MKNGLCASTALVGIGLLAGSAPAEDRLELEISGIFNEAYMAVLNDNDEEGEAGDDRNSDGLFNGAEIRFSGSTELDNGLTLGVGVELEGETDDDQIGEAWVFVAGGFGELLIGSIDDALSYSCVLPPGDTENFSAFSPDQWAANTAISNPACTGVEGGEGQKFLYLSPFLGGFQLSFSYAPDSAENHIDGAGPHIGMVPHEDGAGRHSLSLYVTYSYEGEDWEAIWGAGGSWETHVEQQPGPDRKRADYYQTGVNIEFGEIQFGGVFEYFNDAPDPIDIDDDDDAGFSDDTLADFDIWVAGLGIAYEIEDQWMVGAQFSHLDADNDRSSGSPDFTQDRAVVTGLYEMAPGIEFDAELAYTWVEADGESAITEEGRVIEDYDAIEIGIGTSISF